MKKLGKVFATIAAVAMLGVSFFSCSGDSGGSGGGDSSKTAHLVKFNASETEWAATDMIIKGSASSGGQEGYLVLNHKIDLPTENVTIEADVEFSSLSGHVGLGFISVDGSNRKGYSMVTGQNIKNTSTTFGGGGNGLNPSVNWATGTKYHFKAVYSCADYVDASEGQNKNIVYTVYDANGTELGTNSTPMYYSNSDIVYPALGGTTASNAKYSNIKIKVAGTSYTFDGLDEQTVLSSLAVSSTSLRLLLNGEGAIDYTCLADGSAAPVLLEYDDSILEVTDDGDGTITVKGITPTTSTTLKVINSQSIYISSTITVVVEDFNSTDNYGALTSVYPADGATNVFEDGELRISFDDEPSVSSTGSISIYDDEGNWVDTIKAADEEIVVQTGNTIKVKNQMIRVDGNSVFFTPHYGALKEGKTYFVAIPKDVITATLNGKVFDGLALNKDDPAWSFTVRAAVTPSSTITVDGSESSAANFRTVHGALLAIGASTGDYTINIVPGTYRELVHFNGAANITLAGTGSNARGTDTVIQWTNLNKWNGSMDTRAVVYFGDKAGDVVVKNLTIENTTARSVVGTADTQAEALYDKSTNKLVVYNSTLLSYQDTVCTKGPSWFYDCTIKGDTDFIWGYSDVALFENCDLTCRLDPVKATSSVADILFVSRCGKKTNAKLGKGYVLLNSTVTVEDGVTCYLGRNAGSGDFYDQIAVVNTAFTTEGEGSVSTDLWSGAKTYDYIDGKEDKVGLKVYGLTGDIDVSKAIDHVGTISAEDYALEFNGRRAILNRVYVVEDDAYAAGSKWDEAYLTALEADASAVEDASKNNDYSNEVVYNGAITYDMGADFNNWLTSNYSGQFAAADTTAVYGNLKLTVAAGGNFKYDSGNACATTANGNIAVPVTGNCTITVRCHSYNSSYIKIGDQTTGTSGETLTYTYEGDAGYVNITTFDTSKVLYIYSIKVENIYNSFDMGSEYNSWLSANYSGQFNDNTGPAYYNHLKLTVAAGGNFKYDSGNACATSANGTIAVPVTGNCSIVITCHSYNSQYIGVVGENDTVTAINGEGGTKLTYNYTGDAGYVQISATNTSKVLYIYSIVVSATE